MDERFRVTVMVRPRQPLPAPEVLTQRALSGHPGLSRAEFAAQYGAAPDDLAKVEAWARSQGLNVAETSAARRMVMLEGTVAQFSAAFQVKLDHYQHPRGRYRGRTGPIHIPAELQPIIEGVFGLDNRPFARPHFRIATPAAAGGPAVTFDPPRVAQLYHFPTGVDGTGQCIGIIELGGGFSDADISAFFGGLGLNAPQVTAVPVDNAQNTFTGQGADGEVALDIQVAGAVAPGARIAVYFTPNDPSGRGFIDAVSAAVNDAVNAPSVISISWGGPDEDPTDNFLMNFEKVLQSAMMMNVTVCTAAGDNGAADETPRDTQGQPLWDGQVHTDYPSSSQFALACGGTRLIANGNTIESETVWNQGKAVFDDSTGPAGTFGSTGGGVSVAFGVPDYQQNAGVPPSLNGGNPGRGVPDVAGVADPATGFNIVLNGNGIAVGGTSGVAPLYAGLIALINQKLGRSVGFINPKIYALPAGAHVFRDITGGNNRVTFGGVNNLGYDAGPGWDPCTGLGTVDGEELAKHL
jgi:kumamolisin